MVMLISRRVGIVRLGAVISESLAQTAVSTCGDRLITTIGSVVDHTLVDEPLPSLLPMEGGSRTLDEYRARKGITVLTLLQGASEMVGVQTGSHLHCGLFIVRVAARRTVERGSSLIITASQGRALRAGGGLLEIAVYLFHTGRTAPRPAR